MLPVRGSEVRPAQRRGDLRVSVAPRLADRLRAARHRDRLEAGQPPKAAIVAAQELAAPDRAVIAPAEPVEHDAQHRRGVERHAVLRQAGGQMGVMVLHRDDRQRILRGEVPPCLVDR